MFSRTREIPSSTLGGGILAGWSSPTCLIYFFQEGELSSTEQLRGRSIIQEKLRARLRDLVEG